MKIPRHAVFGSLLALGLLASQGSPKPKRAVEIRIGEIGIFQIQKGRHVLLSPRDRATGKLIGPKP